MGGSHGREGTREGGAKGRAAAGSECVILSATVRSANFTYKPKSVYDLNWGYFFSMVLFLPSPPGMRTCPPFFGDDLTTSNPVFFSGVR